MSKRQPVAALCGLAVLAAAAPLAAQPPATQEPPKSVNLTNAGGELAAFPVRNPAAVEIAIRAGDTRGVLEAGGTATDYASALRVRCAGGETMPLCARIPDAGSERYITGPGGALGLAGQIKQPDGLTRMVGSPLPDAQGIPAPPGTADMSAGPRGGARPAPGGGVIGR